MKLKRRSLAAEVPSMAMGDIAFNLLIFFFILARAQDDSHQQWKPATTSRTDAATNVRAVVLVDVENKLYLNNQEIGVGQLGPKLETILEGAPPGQRTVLLKINKEAPASRFEPILAAVSEVGGELLHVLEKQRD